MSEAVITVENLGKKYQLRHRAERQRYQALRDVLADGTKSVVKRLWSAARSFPLRLDRGEGQGEVSRTASTEDFWALKDVSFEVKQGEVVGIIGRNGAGKSTLLKILSRITEPTEGRITIKGRVASLLEVGTGFHPELTGRENIFLNGAILGMGREEIRRKFDEIVSFAEVEKFLDTPVKRYSSGMYVRLAFAVAAHLEPEILIVDEVLAVGDAQFQKKCLGKMGEVAKGGRTVLFVSHNMGAIRNLCTTGALLEKGCLHRHAGIAEAINEYNQAGVNGAAAAEYVANKVQPEPHFTRIQLTQGGRHGTVFRMDQSIRVEFEFDTKEKADLVVTIVLRNSQGVWIHHSTDEFAADELDRGTGRRTCEIPPYALATENYFVTAALGVRYGDLFEKLTDALRFEVEFAGKASDRTTASSWKGLCGPGLLRWA
jgi:lipopolysaccharide transport system ATP-binding protein